MPIYEVENPETGEILEIEGDSEPTLAELEQIFSETGTPGSLIDSVTEPAAALVGGLGNEIAAGISGLARLATTGDASAAAGTVKSTREALPDFSPETRAGKAGLQVVGDLAQAGIDIVNFPLSGLVGLGKFLSTGDFNEAAKLVRDVQGEGFGATLGEEVFEATDSPLAATAASLTPDIAATLTGAKGVQLAAKSADKLPSIKRGPPALIDPDGNPTKPFLKELEKHGAELVDVADELPRLPDGTTPKKAAELVIKRKLKAGDTDGFLAAKSLDEAGRIVDDSVAKEAIRQGFSEGDVQAAKVASSGTKKRMKQMLNIRKQIEGNSRKAMDMRPSDVIGESFLERLKYIRGVANDARTELNQIAETRLAGKQVNTDSVADDFAKVMDDLDIDNGLIDTSTTPPKVDFTGSMISKDPTSQKVIQDVIDLLFEVDDSSALRAHKMKRQLDAMIDFNKKSKDGLTEAGRNAAKAVRASLNKVIREVDDDYARVNDTLSASLDAMNGIEKAVGPSIDIWGVGNAKAIGQDFRSLMSNNKTRVRLENALNTVDDLAQEFGGVFTDDIKQLALFNKTLDDRFGNTARTSIGGEIQTGVKRAMKGRDGVVEAVVDKGAEKLEGMRGINDAAAFRAMESLVRRGIQPGQGVAVTNR